MGDKIKIGRDVDKAVVYHKNCRDGFCAAWLLHMIPEFEDALFIPAQYEDPLPPEVLGKDLYIADFSYPRQVMLSLMNQLSGIPSITVFDHHETAEADLKSLTADAVRVNTWPRVYFDLNKSGARLVADWILSGAWLGKVPLGISSNVMKMVLYVEDRDLWRHELADSHEINAMIETLPYRFDDWTLFADRLEYDYPLVWNMGRAICAFKGKIILEHANRADNIMLERYQGRAVNATVMFSEIAGRIAEDQGIQFGAVYFRRADGMVQVSLRSRQNGLDVGALAKRFGGGGHRHASGFAIDPNTWEEVLRGGW